jgi:hypothetical protein
MRAAFFWFAVLGPKGRIVFLGIMALLLYGATR